MYLEYIDQEKMLQGIKGALKINSVVTDPVEGKPFGEGSAAALNYALDLAKKMGFKTTNLDNMVGFADYGEGDKMVAVLGHMDVVPAGEGWKYDPFDLTIDNGVLYGRGIADDKGPMIAALFALDAVVKSKKPLKNKVRIIFGADEEVDCHDMERYMETERIPDMAFTPDAEYPAIYGEKGLTHYTIKKVVRNLVRAEAGTVVNAVPDKAIFTFNSGDSEITIEATGKTAHGSTPHLGKNAFDNLVNKLHKTGAYDKLEGELKEFIDVYEEFYLEDYYGEKLGMDMSNPDTGRNSSNVGVVSFKDLGDGTQEIMLTCDFRFIPGYDMDDGVRKLEKMAKEHDMILDVFKRRKALFMPKDSGLITTLMGVFERNTGIKMEPVLMGGGTYAKCLPNTVAFGPLFPGEEDPIHLPNEYMTLDNLLKNTEIMAQAIYELATYEE